MAESQDFFAEILLCTEYSLMKTNKLFPKRSTHLFHPVLLMTLGHLPWPRVMSILSNGLGRNTQKTMWNFRMGSFAYYSQAPLTKSISPEVSVSDPGPPGKLDEIYVHFSWRGVYCDPSLVIKTTLDETCKTKHERTYSLYLADNKPYLYTGSVACKLVLFMFVDICMLPY